MSAPLPRQAPYPQALARSAGALAGRPAAVPAAVAGHDLDRLRSRFSVGTPREPSGNMPALLTRRKPADRRPPRTTAPDALRAPPGETRREGRAGQPSASPNPVLRCRNR
jgi:hypothetical protein